MPPLTAPKGTILIVDDNPTNLDLLSNLLTAQDYEVNAATNGSRALRAMRSFPPDLVMLDIMMPEMDGYEVCRRMKADPTFAAVPVIFLSALEDGLDKAKAFAVGGADYVSKPFQIEEVLARIDNQLNIFRLQKHLELKNVEMEERNRELAEANGELARKNRELAQKNEELIEAHKRADAIFSALAKKLPNTVLDGRYRVEEEIGTGGFGVVYRAVQLGLDRPVAVKVFRPQPGNDSPEAVERFRREGMSACRVRHPNAVQILDSNISAEGIVYLVMELLRGHSLASELRRFGRLPLSRCVKVLAPVCRALAAAHAAGIIHRDIKPDNIFLHRGEDGEIVKVLDFGIAKLMSDNTRSNEINLTETGMLIGTVPYMSPERFRAEPLDGRADVYSVGVILYEALGGRRPFPHDSRNPIDTVLKILNDRPEPLRRVNPDVPAKVERVVMDAMSRLAEMRPTADELATMLENLISDGTGRSDSVASHSTLLAPNPADEDAVPTDPPHSLTSSFAETKADDLPTVLEKTERYTGLQDTGE